MSVYVRPTVHTFKHEYLRDQSANHNQIYLKHHWGWGKTALDFGADWFTTLVYMATDSFHRVIDIMGKTVLPLFMPQTLKKWGAYWFGHVRACVRPFKNFLKPGF